MERIASPYHEDLVIGPYAILWRCDDQCRAVACPDWGETKDFVLDKVLPLFPGGGRWLSSLHASWGQVRQVGEGVSLTIGGRHLIRVVRVYDLDVTEHHRPTRALVASGGLEPVVHSIRRRAEHPVLVSSLHAARAFERRINARAQRSLAWGPSLFAVEYVETIAGGTALEEEIVRAIMEDRNSRRRRYAA